MNRFTALSDKATLLVVVALFAFFGFSLLNQKPSKRTDRQKLEQLFREKTALLPTMPQNKGGNTQQADQPEMAAMQDFFMTVDPATGTVPKERLRQTYLETRSQKSSVFSGDTLQWLGTSANMGGRTRAIMWDPNDPAGKKVWAGGVTGGLWFRNDITDDQTQWQPVNDFWPSLNISCVTYDPNNPTTFYVGTGEAQTALIIYRESSGVGDGIWKSSDAGATWQLMESTLEFEYVTDILVRNEDGNSVIYAGVASGNYHGVIHQSQPADGLFRSEDGGITWDQVLPEIPGYGEPYAVADIEMSADGRIFIGTMQNVEIEGGAVVLFSDEGLQGSWTVYDDYVAIIENNSQYNIPGRVMIGCAPSDANVVYAVVAAGYSDGFNYYRGRYILKSTNQGETWQSMQIPDSEWATLAWHAFFVEVNPGNPNVIYTGGIDMWKTNAAGTSWNHISDWSAMYWGGGDDYIHADQHGIAFKPGSSTEFICCSDGGVFYTTTAANNYPVFMEKNQGYNTLQFYTCDMVPQAGSAIYCGGLQDNGTLLYQNQPLTINDMIDGGDGAYCFFDDELEMLITSVYYNRYSVFLNWNNYDYLDYYSGIFINPADFDRQNNTLYANAVSFFGAQANQILRISNIPYSSNGSFIALPTQTSVYFSHVKVSPYSSALTGTTLFLGTQSGQVFRVNNAQATPLVTEITGDEFPAAYISCIAIGETEDVLLVVFSNYGVSSLWQTLDGGGSWTEVEGNLPDIPVRWAIYHPDNDNQVMLATELGVWTTTDVNAVDVNWMQNIGGMANVRVDMLILRESDQVVLAATHGRGFFTATFPLQPNVSVPETEGLAAAVFPNPSTGIFHVKMGESSVSSSTISVFDEAGRLVFQKSDSMGQTQETIDLSGFSKGNYVLKIQQGKKIKVEKLILK